MSENRKKYGLEFDCDKLANDLRVYQMKEKVTLDELAARTGIGKSTLSRFRNKKENALFVEVMLLCSEMNYELERYVREK